MSRPALPSLAQACALAPAARAALIADRRRILVVGAGGWIGRALLRGLHDALGPDTWQDRVFAFGSSARDIDLGDGLAAQQRPLGELSDLPQAPSVLLHLAFLTKDKVAGMAREDYVAANLALSRSVLDALDLIGVDRLFVASSGAAAYADDPAANEDLRIYGALKRDDEDMFAGWAEARAGRRAVVTRIYSLAGPFINKHDTYALASFVLDALAGRPIAVHAPMRVVRSYVAIRELMSLVMVQLLSQDGPAVRRYDSGGEPHELGEVAGVVASLFGTAVERAAITRTDDNLYAGASAPYAALLAEAGIVPVALPQQVLDTAVTLATP
jgi:nucleoside-diphosphate-sugar epimerase